MTFLRMVATVLVATSMVAPAMASSFDILQQHRSVFLDSTGNGGSISGKATLWEEGRQRNYMMQAGGMQLQRRQSGSNDAYTDFIAFCVEIAANLETSHRAGITYAESSSLLDPLRRTLVATLYQEVYDPTGSVTHQGAFQLALWKLAHGDVSQSDADGFDIRATSSLSQGVMSFTRRVNGSNQSRTFDYYTPGVFDLAQDWLDNLNGVAGGWTLIGSVSDHVTFLSNGTSQDLVTAAFNPLRDPSSAPAPIPLPPSALLSGAGVAFLLLLRRIKRKV